MLHAVCNMWSCSFLLGAQHVIYTTQSVSSSEVRCCYCNDPLVGRDGKIGKGVLNGHMIQHNFRKCDQKLYFCGQQFRQHFQDQHKAISDATLFAGGTLLSKHSHQKKPFIFLQLDFPVITHGTHADTEMTVGRTQVTDQEMVSQHTPASFMDLTDIPQRREPTKLRRKASVQATHIKAAQEIRKSMHFLAHSATADIGNVCTATSSPHADEVDYSTQSQPQHSTASEPVNSLDSSVMFYRKTFDASTRNRIYLRDMDEPLSEDALHPFRQLLGGSVFGGLVLHSSLVGAIPARLTNAVVDIYPLPTLAAFYQIETCRKMDVDVCSTHRDA